MKYIKREDNIERVYEVSLDGNRLLELIILLDRFCYVKKFSSKQVQAHFYNEATEKIENIVNNANEKINESYQITSWSKNPYWYRGKAHDVTYEAVSRESVGLVNIIKALLDKLKDNEDCTLIIDELRNYINGPDFVPFNNRVEEESIKLNKLLETNDENLIDGIKRYQNAVIEAKLNKNYDFKKLLTLYLKVLGCIEYNLVDEITENKTR